ncbi:pLS20_p028 family conjugation system transmembrane protein, partial [Metabacillus niabensis]|uniref:pLS20_p028 family conjugation system transmembrane protein n=1 Tax=Metabacillus niabensis TaxID=324854 RepID=UPI0039A3A47F
MSDEKVIDILLKFNEHLSLANLLNAPLRVIGWGIILLLSYGVDALAGGLKEVYSLINFFDSPEIQGFIDDYMGVIFALAGLALAWLGWKVIVIKDTDLNKVVTNSLIAVSLFVVLPWAMQQGEDLVSAGVEALDEGKMSQSTKIIKSNITDVYALDGAGWSNLNPDPKNFIKDKTSVGLMDITETVDTGGFWSSTPLSDDGVDILTQKLNDASGEYKLEDLQSNFFTDDEAYYRYSWHPFFMIIELITLLLVLTFTIFKTAQLIIELGLLKIFAQATVLTDLETGQRNKRIFEKIRNTFIVLYLIMVILNVYLLFIDYITTTDVSKPVQLVLIIAAGIFVIDGPNFVEELFGIDAGLKSASRSIMGLFYGAKTAGMAGNAIGKSATVLGGLAKASAKGLGKAGLLAAQGGAGIKGALDGFNENRNAKNNSSQDSPLNKLGSGKDSMNQDSRLREQDSSSNSGGFENKPGALNGMENPGGKPLGSTNQPGASGGTTEPGNTPMGSKDAPGASSGMTEPGNTPIGSMNA